MLVFTHKLGRWTQGVGERISRNLFELPLSNPPPRWERVLDRDGEIAGERDIPVPDRDPGRRSHGSLALG
jgi:hypothetical protein